MLMVEYLKFVKNVIESDFFSNLISLLGLIVAVITLFVGGKKLSQAISEYKTKKRNAVFSYHMNLKIFIWRLIRLVSNSQSQPLMSLYLLSPNEDIRKKYSGNNNLSLKLLKLSEDFLDYLSTTPEQIPVADSKVEDSSWNNLIKQLTNYLADFLLLDSNVYLPNLNTEESVRLYHDELIHILNTLLNLIETSQNAFWYELKQEEVNHTN